MKGRLGMTGEERRTEIVRILSDATEPVSGIQLAEHFDVSRQVIVQDIALLRAKNIDIISGKKGYLVKNNTDKPETSGDGNNYSEARQFSRIFKVIHDDKDVEKELTLIVDLGGRIQDVFVYHKIYGVIRGELNISTREDVANYMKNLNSGKSSMLKNVTSGFHYHTVYAVSELMLDVIQEKLAEYGFLAKLQEYEPIDFSRQ